MDSLNIILSISGIIIGASITYLITKHYYKKSMMFEADMRHLTVSLESIYFKSKYPSIFDTTTSFKKDYWDQSPEDKDIPHLWMICCESNIVIRGKELLLLFRMIDLGRNLPDSGIEIRNKLNNYELPYNNEGFGWFSCRLNIPLDAPLGNHNVSFTFTDYVGNINYQDFTYTIK